MRVPEEVLKCVAFVGIEHGFETEWIGTGFLVTMEEKEGQHNFRFPYFVTAGHVADAVEAVPFKLRVNDKTGKAREIRANEHGDVVWHRHLNKKADVAVCQWELPSADLDVKAIKSSIFFSKEIAEHERIGPGDEVIISGLFAKVTGESRNLPIIRIGNLSLVANEPIVPSALGDIEAYVIEARSLGGISGSPVFIRQTVDLVGGTFKWGTNIPTTTVAYSSVIYLLGLIHGHWDIEAEQSNDPQVKQVDDGINIGLAIVVPATQILDILNNEALIKMRRKQKKEAIAKHKGATMDVVREQFTQSDFEQALRKASKRIPSSGSDARKK